MYVSESRGPPPSIERPSSSATPSAALALSTTPRAAEGGSFSRTSQRERREGGASAAAASSSSSAARGSIKRPRTSDNEEDNKEEEEDSSSLSPVHKRQASVTAIEGGRGHRRKHSSHNQSLLSQEEGLETEEEMMQVVASNAAAAAKMMDGKRREEEVENGEKQKGLLVGGAEVDKGTGSSPAAGGAGGSSAGNGHVGNGHNHHQGGGGSRGGDPEIVGFMLRALQGLGYTKAATALQQEAGLMMVVEGGGEIGGERRIAGAVEGDRCRAVAASIGSLASTDVGQWRRAGGGTNAEDGLNRARLIIFREQYMEALNDGQVDDALSLLRGSLAQCCQQLGPPGLSVLHSLALLLVCPSSSPSPSSLLHTANGKGGEGGRATNSSSSNGSSNGHNGHYHHLHLHHTSSWSNIGSPMSLLHRVTGWEGPAKGSRRQALKEIESLLQGSPSSSSALGAAGSSSTSSAANRLALLLEQAKAYQALKCPLHNPPPASSSSSSSYLPTLNGGSRINEGASTEEAGGGGATIRNESSCSSNLSSGLWVDHRCGKGVVPQTCQAILEGHQDEVWCLAYSHTGHLLASGGKDQSIILWDLSTFIKGLGTSAGGGPVRARHVLRGLRQTPQLLRFNPSDTFLLMAGDGSRIAAAAAAGQRGGRQQEGGGSSQISYTIHRYSVESGRCVNTYVAHTGEVMGLCWLAEGERFVSGGRDKRILLWDASEGNVVCEWSTNIPPISDLAIIRDGRMILALCGDHTLKILRLEEKKTKKAAANTAHVANGSNRKSSSSSREGTAVEAMMKKGAALRLPFPSPAAGGHTSRADGEEGEEGLITHEEEAGLGFSGMSCPLHSDEEGGEGKEGKGFWPVVVKGRRGRGRRGRGEEGGKVLIAGARSSGEEAGNRERNEKGAGRRGRGEEMEDEEDDNDDADEEDEEEEEEDHEGRYITREEEQEREEEVEEEEEDEERVMHQRFAAQMTEGEEDQQGVEEQEEEEEQLREEEGEEEEEQQEQQQQHEEEEQQQHEEEEQQHPLPPPSSQQRRPSGGSSSGEEERRRRSSSNDSNVTAVAQEDAGAASSSSCPPSSDWKLIEIEELSFKRVTSISLGQGGQYLLLNMAGGQILCWNVQSHSKGGKYEGRRQGRYLLASQLGGVDDRFVAAGSEDGKVLVWHRSRSTPLFVLKGHGGLVSQVAWCPTHPHLLASASDDHTLRLWVAPESCSSSFSSSLLVTEGSSSTSSSSCLAFTNKTEEKQIEGSPPSAFSAMSLPLWSVTLPPSGTAAEGVDEEKEGEGEEEAGGEGGRRRKEC